MNNELFKYAHNFCKYIFFSWNSLLTNVFNIQSYHLLVVISPSRIRAGRESSYNRGEGEIFSTSVFIYFFD